MNRTYTIFESTLEAGNFHYILYICCSINTKYRIFKIIIENFHFQRKMEH